LIELDRDAAVRPGGLPNRYNPMAQGAKVLYETGTPEQISAAVALSKARDSGGGFMGFFDDLAGAIGGAVNTVGQIAGAAGRVIGSVPGLENLVPFGSTISAVGSLASGGIAGLAGNMIGRAQTLAPVAAGILGLPPQVGQLAGGLLGRLNIAPPPPTGFTGGGGGGSGGGGASRTIGDLPMLAPLNPNLLNVGRNILPTTIALRDPSMMSLVGPTVGPGGVALPANASGCPMSVGAYRSALLRQASAAAGFRISWKKLLYILLHFGIEIAKRLTQLDEASILWLYTTRPHRGRRGPHLRTIAKRARQVQGYRHSIARIARIIGAGRTRVAAAPARRMLPAHSARRK
jgi:hypothetical protein